ncbi:MAG: CHAD domain-containing protein [Paludibacter sp.]
MKSIIENYNLLVSKFQEMEKDTTPDEIHDKRVILRRIFPILTAFEINPSKVKNVDKAFKLFGKLRDIQIQIEKLENPEQYPQLIEYLEFLKKKEVKLKEKVSKFSKKKELKFPKIKKKKKVDSKKIIYKANRQLNILTEEIQSLLNLNAIEIHTIRIDFKKYRYLVEVLKYIEKIDEGKLEEMKYYQDVLGEIHDYEVLIKGINKYYKKKKLDDQVDVDVLENEQNILEEKFENEAEQFIEVCKAVICIKYDVVDLNSETSSKTDQKVTLNEPEKEIENVDVQKEELTSPPISSKKNPKKISAVETISSVAKT